MKGKGIKGTDEVTAGPIGPDRPPPTTHPHNPMTELATGGLRPPRKQVLSARWT